MRLQNLFCLQRKTSVAVYAVDAGNASAPPPASRKLNFAALRLESPALQYRTIHVLELFRFCPADHVERALDDGIEFRPRHLRTGADRNAVQGGGSKLRQHLRIG